MARDDWFGNTTWNDKIAATFEANLKRAGDKSQRLRLQARMLAESHPLVALELLERYFKETNNFGDAQAFVDKATALLALGRSEEAIAAYADALKEEKKMPSLLTQAYVELPYFVSVHALAEHAKEALEFASKEKSVFKRHPKIGLVSKRHNDALRRLREYCDA